MIPFIQIHTTTPMGNIWSTAPKDIGSSLPVAMNQTKILRLHNTAGFLAWY